MIVSRTILEKKKLSKWTEVERLTKKAGLAYGPSGEQSIDGEETFSQYSREKKKKRYGGFTSVVREHL